MVWVKGECKGDPKEKKRERERWYTSSPSIQVDGAWYKERTNAAERWKIQGGNT